MSRTIAKGAFYALALGVWVWMMTNTLSVTQMIFPDQEGLLGGMLPYMALIMFDVGAAAWLFVFLRYSEGVMQRTIAVVVSFISLVGGIFLSVAHLYLGGQTLTSVPAEIGTWVLWAIGGMTLVHGVAIWASHIVSPEELRLIRTQTMLDNGKALALDRAEARLDQEIDGIADSMAGVYARSIRTELLRGAGVIGNVPQIIDVAPVRSNGRADDVASAVVAGAASESPFGAIQTPAAGASGKSTRSAKAQ